MKRKKLYFHVIILAACMLFLFFARHDIYAQEQKAKKLLVTDITVEGNNTVSTDTILLKIKTAMGRELIQQQLNEDIKRLYASGFFSDVSVNVEDYEDGVRVIFSVTEKAVVVQIVFKGNDSIGSRKLLKELETKEKEILSRRVASSDAKKIKAYYRKKGFPLVETGYDVEIDNDNKATVYFNINEKIKYKINSINFSGNDSINEKTLLKQIQTKKAWWWFWAGVLDENTLEDDIARIKEFYRNKGFIDVDVESDVDYVDEEKGINIIIKINEGLQYKIGNISLEGNRFFNDDLIEKEMEMKQGNAYSPRGLRSDVIRIQTLYFDEGYMDCRVSPDTLLDKYSQSINVKFIISEGEVNYINKIRIAGNTKTKDVVIRRELRLYPGNKYEGEKLRRSKERLYNLGFFEEILFETEPTQNLIKKDLLVSVKESKTGEFSFGGGYSSVDRLVGFVQVMQRNFDIMNFPTFTGAGQNLAIKATIGSVRRNYELSFTEPWIFGHPLSFGFDLFSTQTLRKSGLGYGYDEEHSGGALRLGKEFTDYNRLDVKYTLEEVKISDVPEDASSALKDEEGANTISTIGATLSRDTRNNKYNPINGYLAYLYGENGGGVIGGDKDFYKLKTGLSVYFNHEEKLVLELKGSLGWVDEYDDTKSVPIYQRFFAGGANTIRGYKERSVGPRDPNTADPIGGESMVLGSAELTYPVFQNFKVATFIDVGNVWEESNDLGSGDLKTGVGAGVRVNTPVGPVKVDYGYPLEEAHSGDDKKGRFHFSMTRGF